MEIITKEDCKEITDVLESITSQVLNIKNNYKPPFNGERYITGKELCSILNITSRTLQEYRDIGLIPYTTIGGKLLYKESDIAQILNNNYVSTY